MSDEEEHGPGVDENGFALSKQEGRARLRDAAGRTYETGYQHGYARAKTEEYERGLKLGKELGYAEAMLKRFDKANDDIAHGDITVDAVGVLVNTAEQATLASVTEAFEELAQKYARYPDRPYSDVVAEQIRSVIAQVEKEYAR